MLTQKSQMKALSKRNPFTPADLLVFLSIAIGIIPRLIRLGDYQNLYYTATVASMMNGIHNFLFASFDPTGTVMVDKPPAAFWLQTAPAALFGVSSWSVTLPQIIMGIVAIYTLYRLVDSVYGRLAGIVAAITLSVLPASVIIDSRNEPDALVSFAGLFAAVCIVKAVQTGKYRWYIMFATLMGIAFNAKMLVGFVPLPALLIFSLITTKQASRQIFLRTVSAVLVLLIVSLSWVTFISLTPTDMRPYVGSTQDNSIWTLIHEYNGLDRFTSLIGPRQQQSRITSIQQQPKPSQGRSGLPLSTNGHQIQGPAPINENVGLFGLFSNRLASRLGWLLPIGLVSLSLSILPILHDRVYQRPTAVLNILRTDIRAAHALLWTGWLGTGLLVFGLANATTTHPYYLVGITIPLSAVIGIGISSIKVEFQKGTPLSWIVVICLPIFACYQIYGARNYVGDWAIAIVSVLVFLSTILMGAGLSKGLQYKPLSSIAMAVGLISILIVPFLTGLTSSERIVRHTAEPTALLPPRPQHDYSYISLETRLIELLKHKESVHDNTILLTINARTAAPFIVSGLNAVAIGGFSGNDPVFTLQSFKDMIATKELVYFLIPGENRLGPIKPRNQQDSILNHVRTDWKDTSKQAELPSGTLFMKLVRH